LEWKVGKPIDRLICNAGVYQPSLPYAKWSVDDHEQTMQINYLSHFLMISLLLDDMTEAKDPRVIMVGSVTGNDNTVGGGGVYPIADLKNLDGFRAGFKNPIAMADGYGFIGAKAYKDSKLCLMMLSNMLHARYHKRTGIAFSSIYPGCIAESPLFREKRAWFRKYFPVFMKYITGGFVGEEEAGQRLFQVAHDPRCAKSGVYWSWNGGPRENRGLEALEKGGQISGGGGAGGGWDSIYENDQSDKVNDIEHQVDLFKYSTEITGAEWPVKKTVVSPCPTLKVIGAISNQMIAKEELKRMAEQPGLNPDGTPIKPKLTVTKKTALVADKVVGGVLKRTVGRVAGFANRRLLGRLPEEALTGSFHEEKPLVKSVVTITTPESDLSLVEDVKVVGVNGSNGATDPVANGTNGATVPVANGANGATVPVANGKNGATAPAKNGVAAPEQVFKSDVDQTDQEVIEDEISVQVFSKETAEADETKKLQATA
jgi:light-dependent protochlorophyllide reductase